MRSLRVLRIGGAAAAALALATSAARAAEDRTKAPACADQPSLDATVAAVTDARGFRLADGREVRLAAIEGPTAPAGDTSAANGAEAARAALAALVLGQAVSLMPLGAADRYGRLPALAFVTRDGARLSVESALVGGGHAFVAPRAETRCNASLVTAEHAARTAKLGLWADPYYEPRQAENPSAVLAARGRFAIVEGKVLSVRESGGTVYVNFGRRWSEDFTVTILKRNLPRFAGAGIEPKTLAGQRVRVRGWVEERGGPWIEAAVPQQIELAERN